MHPDVVFTALGYSFVVASPDERLGEYVDSLFAAFVPPAPAASARIGLLHRYELAVFKHTYIDHLHHELLLDGAVVARAGVRERLVASLVHDLNRRVLADCSDPALHAGGVCFDGVAVALPGAMEAGKSTLTAGLVRAGFDYLTDEAFVIDRGTLRVRPYPKPLSIDPGAWHLFPELEPQADLATDGYKVDQWQVPLAAIRADAVGGPCPVGVIVFPQYRANADTVLEPLGRGEALVELAHNTFKFDERGAPELDALADVVRGAECYRLTVGELNAAVAAVSGIVGVPTSVGR